VVGGEWFAENADEFGILKWDFDSLRVGVEQFQAARIRVNGFAMCGAMFVGVIVEEKFSKVVRQRGSQF